MRLFDNAVGLLRDLIRGPADQQHNRVFMRCSACRVEIWARTSVYMCRRRHLTRGNSFIVSYDEEGPRRPYCWHCCVHVRSGHIVRSLRIWWKPWTWLNTGIEWRDPVTNRQVNH